ncbi:hypothetical protein FS837_006690 [Tulasnella sp. UAMH 9824]|nr:hypothetical protein FS837_006690 [Tulasnella sp. UAMH 9824]
MHDYSIQTPAAELTDPRLRGCGQLDPPEQVPPTTSIPALGGLQFWLIFIAPMTSVSTALPTIVEDLGGADFAWVGSAFALGSTAILPLVVIGSILFFGLGSGLCGGAKSMSMLIAGRTIQGIGGGGILAMVEIVVADLVPLRQRGTYMGSIGAYDNITADLNLPLTAFALVLVWFFLRLKVPQDDLRSKMRRMDWIGNLLVIAGTTLSIIALTWAGAKHPWSSYQVLLPLILGLAVLVGFFAYEATVAIEPVVPWELVNNRTSFLGYATTFLHGIIATCVISNAYLVYLPVYFQATLMQSPVKSGVSLFGTVFTTTPGAVTCGVTVGIFNIYRPQNMTGWVLTVVGLGLFTLLKVSTPKAQWVGFQIIEGVGLGILYAAPTFPILAPLPVGENAHALAFFAFVKSYSQTWGITLGATILQNQLKTKLPAEFLTMFPSDGVDITYAAIPQISGLPEPMRTEVRAAFASSLRVIWLAMIGICAVGLLSVLVMKEVKMHEATDEGWGLEERKRREVDEERARTDP